MTIADMVASERGRVFEDGCRSVVKVAFDEFKRFVVMLPEHQLQKGGILRSWIDSADWMEGIEYRCTPHMLQLNPIERWCSGGQSRCCRV